MNVAVIYYSKHHENTKKILDGINKYENIELFDICKETDFDFSKYDVIGLASGIYYSKFNKEIIKFVNDKLPENKAVFLIYTCGAKRESYIKDIEHAVISKNGKILGSYGCLGFDTYGPFKIIGGLAKGHPDENDINEAIIFYKNIINKYKSMK